MFSEDCSSGLMVRIFFPVKHWKPANYGGCAANTSATAENRQPLWSSLLRRNRSKKWRRRKARPLAFLREWDQTSVLATSPLELYRNVGAKDGGRGGGMEGSRGIWRAILSGSLFTWFCLSQGKPYLMLALVNHNIYSLTVWLVLHTARVRGNKQLSHSQ